MNRCEIRTPLPLTNARGGYLRLFLPQGSVIDYEPTNNLGIVMVSEATSPWSAHYAKASDLVNACKGYAYLDRVGEDLPLPFPTRTEAAPAPPQPPPITPEQEARFLDRLKPLLFAGIATGFAFAVGSGLGNGLVQAIFRRRDNT